MNILISVMIIVLTFSTLYFPLRIFINLLKYKEAALGLIFTHLDESILSFKIYAVAILIFALSRLLDLLNVTYPSRIYDFVDNVTTLLYLIINILLIYAFYKLSVIMKIDKEKT